MQCPALIGWRGDHRCHEGARGGCVVPSPLRALDQRRWVSGTVRWRDNSSGRDGPLGEGSGWETDQSTYSMHMERSHDLMALAKFQAQTGCAIIEWPQIAVAVGLSLVATLAEGGVPLLGATVGLLGAMAWCHDGV